MILLKTVIITGASRGIGRSIALRFAKENVRMVITCKENSSMLEEVKNEVLALGSDCITFTGDLSISDNVKHLKNLVETTYDDVDILINNAGISYTGLIHDMTDAAWHNVIGSNLDSVFFCCREFIPYMISKQNGRIINISSIWGEHGASCEVAYSASKGAVNAFTKALAKELAPSNISVNALACGMIDTDMNSHLSNEEQDSIIDSIPAMRIGTPDEVAEAVYSLSTQSNYLTGQIITMDGGWM